MTEKIRARAEKARGQILILMILLMTTLIIFFGMVVNIGHLVQAKINLQNSVDLAAMSGASWQARFLNHIALINYRMRQNYKFVLFDIYVTQSRYNTGFIKQVTQRSGTIPAFDKLLDPRTPGELALGICQTIPGYEPSTPEELRSNLRRASVDTDFCKFIEASRGSFSGLAEAPPIPIFGSALAGVQRRGNQAFRDNCLASSGQNQAYFNYIIRHLRDRNFFQMEEMSIILREFSQAFSTGAEREAVSSSGGLGDQSIYRTFYDNLITANRDGVDAESLQYINPPETRAFTDEGIAADPQTLIGEDEPGGNFPNYFERQLVGFSLSVIESQWTGNRCRFIPRLVQAADPADPTKAGFVFLGLSRARHNRSLGASEYQALKIPFQIVLQAQVRPSLLFWPRGLTPTLVATSAAKPFGSRIAPPIERVNFEVSGLPIKKAQGQPANLSFYPGDIRQSGSNEFPGIGHIRILKHLEASLRNPAGRIRMATPHGSSLATPERPSVIDSSFQMPGAHTCQSNPMPFLCNALAPTLYEGLLWTVFPDPPSFLALNPAQVSEYPIEFSLPIGSQSTDPRTVSRLQKMSSNYFMPDRMRQRGVPIENIGGSSSLWHVSTLIPQSEMGRFSSTDGKPLFYANESSAASAFNPDWNVNQLEGYLQGGAADGRRGYQIRLISMEQACEEIQTANAVQLPSLMREYCEGSQRVFH